MGSSNDRPAVRRFQQRFVCCEACLSEFVSTLFDMNTGAGASARAECEQVYPCPSLDAERMEAIARFAIGTQAARLHLTARKERSSACSLDPSQKIGPYEVNRE